ncbi:L-dopachrome tautomerase yellow-f-like [Phlebotomus argentipes]|uniref:L-dopachrome tautomerase yellow-f-like n=1 Tax=Phlebotomus argentipes TaxID=94469 RepID=UPI002893430A|nr:L-dopachrome tautomerase yellow-f-like [Phlebotomus argentipes]
MVIKWSGYDTYIGPYKYNLPYNNDIIGIEYHHYSKLMFGIVVRLRPGVPSTLNAFCTTDYAKNSSPRYWGFPNYEVNQLKASYYGQTRDAGRQLEQKHSNYSAGYFNYFFGGSRHSLQYGTQKHYKKTYNSVDGFNIVSSHHLIVDNRCNRLYALDSGTLHYSATEIYTVQLPAILVFDLPLNGCQTRNFPVIRRVEIPGYLFNNPVGYNFLSLDQQPKGTCDDVYVYASNAFDNRVLVYDYKKNSFWNVEHTLMKPFIAESYMLFREDYNYQLPLGVVNIALGWPDKNGDRPAFFTPGSSQAQYVFSSKYLKNPKSFSYKHGFKDYITLLGYRGCGSQAYREVFDESTGVMFFAEMQSNKLTCWNTALPISPDTVGVVFESEALQFISGLLIDPTGYLWFHSSQVPIDYLTQIPLDITDVNSRTFRIKVPDAISGTVCDTSSYYGRNLHSIDSEEQL